MQRFVEIRHPTLILQQDGSAWLRGFVMQRFVEIRPLHGTTLILQQDGSAWLVWDDSFTTHNEIDNWLRAMVERHEAVQTTTVEVLSIAANVPKEQDS
jgi:hypothetical protein